MKKVQLHDLGFVPFISAKEIDEAILRMAQEIDASYRDLNPILLVVLNGAFVFAADLVRKISIPIRLDFLRVASYDGTSSTGKMEEHFLWKMDLVGQHVIFIEDIVDTGFTARYLLQTLAGRGPNSLALCTMLDRTSRRIVQIPIAFRCFEIPDRFIIGWGLDYKQLYRNLGCIAVMNPEKAGENRPRQS